MQEPAQAACPGKQPLTGAGLRGNRTLPWWATVTVILFLSERDTARVCLCRAGRERGHDQLPQRPDQFALSDKDDGLTGTDLVDGPAWHRPVRRRQAQGSPFDQVHARVGITLPSGIQHPPADASRSGHLGDHHPHPASMSPPTLVGPPRSSRKCLSRAGSTLLLRLFRPDVVRFERPLSAAMQGLMSDGRNPFLFVAFTERIYRFLFRIDSGIEFGFLSFTFAFAY
jgi:hypothetical protein